MKLNIEKLKSGGGLSKKYIEAVRKKPGGSNVGKKTFADGSKRTGPYAGPSGGAPKGSYPIPDLKHAKSALSLAHNAPNPAGIKAAVYRKYPGLKSHKKGGNLPSDVYIPLEVSKVLKSQQGSSLTADEKGALENTGSTVVGKSGIHIDPKNKGKFNLTKKKTGKSTEELTHSKNPLTRKRAVFAQNTSHWKHQKGGVIERSPMLENLMSLTWK